MIDFFSTSPGSQIENIRVHDNIIRTVPGNNSHYYLLSMTEVDDAIITRNTFTMENVGNHGAVRLGSNTSIYAGALSNIQVSNNTFNNCYVQTMNKYAPVNNQPIDVDSNTFNFTSTLGVDVGAIRFTANSGTHGYINFTNNEITVDMGSPNGINGAIYSNGVDVEMVTLDNTYVVYNNGAAARPFGYMRGSFNNTNMIMNSNLSGANGSNALEVVGTQSVQIVNSSDNEGNPITIK